jgi:hypothetical protein
MVTDSKAYELIAEGFRLLAAAARRNEQAPANDVEWIDPKTSPLGKRQTLALARAGVVASTKIGRRVLVGRASLASFLDAHRRDAALRAPDEEDLFAEREAS